MDGATFKKIVNYYGEENIIGIGFDNSAGVTFGKGEFSLSTVFIEAIECVQIVGFDNLGHPYHTIKHVENIQSIMVRDAAVDDINCYDRISLRG